MSDVFVEAHSRARGTLLGHDEAKRSRGAIYSHKQHGFSRYGANLDYSFICGMYTENGGGEACTLNNSNHRFRQTQT